MRSGPFLLSSELPHSMLWRSEDNIGSGLTRWRATGPTEPETAQQKCPEDPWATPMLPVLLLFHSVWQQPWSSFLLLFSCFCMES